MQREFPGRFGLDSSLTQEMDTPMAETGAHLLPDSQGAEMITEPQWKALATAAKAASANAYSRYSNFRVGAATLSSGGAMASGCNVENASYGLTMCAERNAVFSAINHGATDIIALALYTPTAQPVTPCGACRQVIAEFGANASIRAYCDGPDIAEFTMEALLPAAFALQGCLRNPT
jgi:cytidine deaminase